MSESWGVTVGRGSNLPSLAAYNQSVVLDAIRKSPDGISRVEIAGLTGLSPQTLSNVSRRLIDGGLVREMGSFLPPGSMGKPRTLLELIPRSKYAIGLHLDPARTTVVITDLRGSVVSRWSDVTPFADQPPKFIEAAVAQIRRLIRESEIPDSQIVGLGLAAPGPLDIQSGNLLQPPLLTHWGNFPVRDAMSALVEFPVTVEKDVTAAAIAEMWLEPSSSLPNFAVLYLGSGAGAGIVLDGQVLRGSSGNAGEVGHITRERHVTQACPCGAPHCLGYGEGVAGIAMDAVDRGIVAETIHPMTSHVIDGILERVHTAAERGERRAQDLVDDLAAYVAQLVVGLMNLLDLDRVVVGGPNWVRFGAAIESSIQQTVQNHRVARDLHPPTISSARLTDDLVAVGAACVVLDQLFSARSSSLLIANAG